MDKKITISIPEELIDQLIKEAEGHRETFEELILRKLKYNDLSFRAPEDFFQKKIIKISIDDLTSELIKQEEFDKLLTTVLEDYFNKAIEDRIKLGEETLKIIRDGKQRKVEKTVNDNEENDSEFKIPDSIWDKIFSKPMRTKEEILKHIEELKKNESNEKLNSKDNK
jgi:rubrerythrin